MKHEEARQSAHQRMGVRRFDGHADVRQARTAELKAERSDQRAHIEGIHVIAGFWR